jgi:hypothetical protein
MDGIFSMVSEHLCGGMVKDIYLEELNAPPFLRFVGVAHDARSYRIVKVKTVETIKTVRCAWPQAGR